MPNNYKNIHQRMIHAVEMVPGQVECRRKFIGQMIRYAVKFCQMNISRIFSG